MVLTHVLRKKPWESTQKFQLSFLGSRKKSKIVLLLMINQQNYRVYSFMLDTLHRVFHIESVNRFLKMIGRIDKEDCAINLRY